MTMKVKTNHGEIVEGRMWDIGYFVAHVGRVFESVEVQILEEP